MNVKELPKKTIDSLLSTPYGEAAYAACEKLKDAGFEAWWVGGAVRDIALGHVPNDVDIATNATPNQVKTAFKDAVEDRRNLASMRAKAKGIEFEITTFRKESAASSGRHPETIDVCSREEDVPRRDFTVNAMYYDPISRQLFDPTDGLRDASEKLVRFIGDPSERIRHDALRILRAVRLRARMDGQYDPATYAALRDNAQIVGTLSGSRVLEELEKLLGHGQPSRGLEDLWELGILAVIAPELHACKGIAQPADYHHEGDVWNHLLACTDALRPDDDADVRIAALLHDIGKVETFQLKERIRFDHHASVSADIATEMLKRWQAPKKRIEKIDWLIRHHMTMETFKELSDERKAHWYHHPWFNDLLRIFWLDIAGTEPADFSFYESIVKDHDAFVDSHPRPPKQLLSGENVMNLLGIRPGEEVGKVLQALQGAQIRNEVTTKKDAEAFVLALGAGQ